jgi:DHA2 family multidrug resistance protein
MSSLDLSSLDDLRPAEPPTSAETIRRRRAWIAFGAMLMANFMAILDIQIVASSVNEIQVGLDLAREQMSWVQTIYLIAEVIGIPLSAYLARAFSTRVYFTVCALGFTLASLACALSWNMQSLLIFRAVQGFLGGGLIPTTMSALFLIFPTERRRLPYVLTGIVSLLAPSLGAASGGYITAMLSWHWLFLVNLVPGLIVAALVWIYADIDRARPHLLRSIDYAGVIGLAAMLGGLQFLLEEAPGRGWWQDSTICCAGVVSLCGSVLFGWRSLRAAQPIVDLRCLLDRNFVAGCVLSFVVGVMLYGVVFLIPTFLGFVRNYDSLHIGHVTMLSGITMFLSAPLAGYLQDRFDGRLMMLYGLVMVALGTRLNANLTEQSDLWTFLVPQLIRGHGFTFCLVPMVQIALGTLPPSLVQSGSGLFNLTRNLGGAVGIASIKTQLLDRSGSHAVELIESGTSLFEVPRAAAVLAYNEVLVLLSGAVLAATLLVLLARKPTQDPHAVTAH